MVSRKPVSQKELGEWLGNRAHGYVFSLDKSIAVFLEALPAEKKKLAVETIREAVASAFEIIGTHFTARTGAQGLNRLPAKASWMIAPHKSAFDGSPSPHFHVVFKNRLFVPSLNKTYAFNARELYSLRSFANAVLNNHVARALQQNFGVRIGVKKGNLLLPDVPQNICKAASFRAKEIRNYLGNNYMPINPKNLAKAALYTRNSRPQKNLRKLEFANLLRASGFKSESICNKIKLKKTTDKQLTAGALRSAKLLTTKNGNFTRHDLHLKIMKTLKHKVEVARISKKIQELEKNKIFSTVSNEASPSRQKLYTEKEAKRAWRIYFTQERVSQVGEQMEPRSGATQEKRIGTKTPEQKPEKQSKPGILESIGKAGDTLVLAAASITKQAAKNLKKMLLTQFEPPVYELDGLRCLCSKKSVQRFVSDLKPIPWRQSQALALKSIFNSRAKTINGKLETGGIVYKQARTPRIKLTRNSIVVIHNSESVSLKEIKLIVEKAKTANANVILTETDFIKNQLKSAIDYQRLKEFFSQQQANKRGQKP